MSFHDHCIVKNIKLVWGVWEFQGLHGILYKFESPKRSGRSIFGECVGWFVKSREVQNSVIQGKIDQGLVVKIRLWY